MCFHKQNTQNFANKVPQCRPATQQVRWTTSHSSHCHAEGILPIFIIKPQSNSNLQTAERRTQKDLDCVTLYYRHTFSIFEIHLAIHPGILSVISRTSCHHRSSGRISFISKSHCSTEGGLGAREKARSPFCVNLKKKIVKKEIPEVMQI